MVPGQGFEPRLPGSEPGVLPLDDPGMCRLQADVIIIFLSGQQRNYEFALIDRLPPPT